MIEFYKDKSNHPMFGKTHNKEALALISKPGELNPIFLRVRKGPQGSEGSARVQGSKGPQGSARVQGGADFFFSGVRRS